MWLKPWRGFQSAMISPLPSNYLQHSFCKSTKQGFFVGGKKIQMAHLRKESHRKTQEMLLFIVSVWQRLFFFLFSPASNIVLMSDKAVLVDFGLTVQMTEDKYIPRDLRGTEVGKQAGALMVLMAATANQTHRGSSFLFSLFSPCLSLRPWVCGFSNKGNCLCDSWLSLDFPRDWRMSIGTC